MRRIYVLVGCAVLLACGIAPCQEVVSAYAGTVHYFEGAVFIDDHALEHKAAVFFSIPNGSTLRTEKGRAEVLLTPGVVLRLDEDSSIRLISNALTDTRVEFTKGAALLDTLGASGAPPVVLTYQHCQIRFPKPGIYRLDSDTSVLQAYEGETRVTSAEGKTSTVDTSKLFFFDLGTVTNKFGEPNEDAFYDWARGRADALSAENQLAAESMDNSAPSDNAPFIWSTPAPNIGSYPTYPIFDTTYYAGPAFNPFGYAAGPFAPFGVWPVVVLERRRPAQSWQHQPWPHRPISGAAIGAGHTGIATSPLRFPVVTPRPAPSISMRPQRPVTGVAPHPVAPAAAHPVFHR
jgi:hypothetical protein